MKRQDIPRFGTLQNLKVVNCSQALAGPVAGTLMAENGADVILIENAKVPDMYRNFPYGWPQERRNMRTICANIFSEEGHRLLEKLLADADILIESSKGGSWSKAGLSDDMLWSFNPKLVIVHISGFGQTGLPEYVKMPSYDTTGQSYSGMALVNGDIGQEPIPFVGPQASDYYTCMTACWSALAGYIRAQETGVGESIDLAQYEATLRPQSDFATRGFNLGMRCEELKVPVSAPASSVFECKDGSWRYLYPAPNHVWKFLHEVGLGDDCGIPKDTKVLFTVAKEYQEIYYPYMKEYCLARTGEEIDALGPKTGCLVCPLLEYTDMLEHPQFKARETIIEYHDDTLDANFKAVAPVPRFNNNPQQIWRGGPTMGVDNEDVLEEAGFTTEEIEALYETGTLKKA